MLSKFIKKYPARHEAKPEAVPSALRKNVDDFFVQFMSEYGGHTFGDGIFRTLIPSDIAFYTKETAKYFPNSKGIVVIFGYDWNGRLFGVAVPDKKFPKRYICCFDFSSNHVFEIDSTLEECLNGDFVRNAKDALAADYFKKWRIKSKNAKPIKHDECVGDDLPLFLGGKDEVTNLKIIKLRTYIEILTKIWAKVRDLPADTPINKIKLHWR
jgi:hypothetical protein